jgi:hypothetical protein
MKYLITLLCLMGVAYGQYTPVFGKYDYKDSIKLSKYKDATGDSCLAVDSLGRIIQRVKGGSGGSGWSLTGNSGTNPSTNFLGTTDNQDLIIKSGLGGLIHLGSNWFGGGGGIAAIGAVTNNFSETAGLSIDTANTIYNLGDITGRVWGQPLGISFQFNGANIYGNELLFSSVDGNFFNVNAPINKSFFDNSTHTHSLGINTGTPAYPLDVTGTGTSTSAGTIQEIIESGSTEAGTIWSNTGNGGSKWAAVSSNSGSDFGADKFTLLNANNGMPYITLDSVNGTTTIFSGDSYSRLTVDHNNGTLDFNNNDSYFNIDGPNRRFRLGDWTGDWYGTSTIFDDGRQTATYKANNGHTFTGNVGIGIAPAGNLLPLNLPDNNYIAWNGQGILQAQANNYTELYQPNGNDGLVMYNDAFYFGSYGSNAIMQGSGTTTQINSYDGTNTMYLNTGNVGIGTSTPTHTLELATNSSMYIDGASGTGINVDPSGYTSFGDVGGYATGSTLTADGTNGNFYTNGGLFGINNIFPGYTLDVAGDINFTNNFRLNGSVILSPYANSFLASLFVGNNSGSISNTGSYNITLGENTLANLTSGVQNCAIGPECLGNITSGGFNVGLGGWALYSSSTGSTNTAIGAYSQYYNTTGSNNTGVGITSVHHNTTGNNNTGIGSWALYSSSTGSNNTAIGDSSLFYTVGSGNVAIGASSGLNETGNNKLYIANSSTPNPLIYGEFDNSILGINGRVAVGGNAPAASSIMDLQSITSGFLPPRMSTTQKNAISSPAAGLIVYDTTLNKLCLYNGSAWQTITSL